jgi:hypothetical protein
MAEFAKEKALGEHKPLKLRWRKLELFMGERYLAEHDLTESEELVLKRGPNFAVANRMSNLDVVCAAESAGSKFPPALGMVFCWMIRCMLEKPKPLASYVTRKESMVLKSLRRYPVN